MNVSRGSGGHPSLTDDQTGLPNRLHFDTVFDVIFATGARGVPVTVILLAIDDYQDWAGRTETSEAASTLQALGETLAPLVRQSDLFARIEKGQFAFCLVDCNMAGAVLVADRIDGVLDPTRQGTGLSFSMGGAAFDLDMERPEELMGAAEKALKSAQAKGTNQMEFSR